MVFLEQEERKFFVRAREVYHKAVQFNKGDQYYDDNPKEKPAFELWTFRHFLGGTAIGFVIPNKRKEFFVLNIVFEIFEQWLSQRVYEWRSASEPLSNKILDVFFTMFGYETGMLFREHRT